MKKLLIYLLTFFVSICIFSKNVFADDKKTIKESTIFSIPDSFITHDGLSQGSYDFAQDIYYPSDDMNNPSNRKYSPVKEMNDFGISWAAAVCRSAESFYRRSYEHNPDFESIDLSEMHLAWFSYHTEGAIDSFGNTTKTGTSTTLTGNDVFNIGGNPVMATFSVANGIGFVDESRFPYKSSYTQAELDNYTKKENCFNPDYRLFKSNWYSLKNVDEIEHVKEYVYRYGQLATCIHADDMMANYDHNLYYYYYGDTLTEENKINYGATIIGYNDNISAEWFQDSYGRTPAHNGAWIVQCNFKNHDDTSTPTTIFISYDEASIANSFAVSFQIEKVDKNTKFHTFQYDVNSGFNYATGYELKDNTKSSYKNEVYFCNVYQPTTMMEAVDSIGIYTYQPNLYANLYLKICDADTDLTFDDIINNSNLSSANDHGAIYRAGYNKFDSYPDDYCSIVYPGQKVYVLIKLSSDSDEIKIPLDGATTTDNAHNIKQITYNSSNLKNVKSFVKTSDGVKDLVELEGAPARIKLFTKPTKSQITYNIDTDMTNPNTIFDFNEDVIGQDILPAIKDGYEFFGWFTDKNYNSDIITNFPFEIYDDYTLYPTFKQRIIFDYEGTKDDIIMHIDDYNTNKKVDAIYLPNNSVTAPKNQEFAGWKYTNKAGKEIEITDFHVPYLFEDAKLNGEDIVCTPIWTTITSTIKNYDYSFQENKVVFLSDYQTSATELFSVNSTDLINKIQTESNETAVVWLESTQIDNDTFSGYKDYFEKENDKVAITAFDINVFKQEKNEDIGTKVQKLTDEIDIVVDVSHLTDLKKAAEDNNLLVSQIHNGNVSTPVEVVYNASNQEISFKADKFSIFAFEYKNAPTPIVTPDPKGEEDTSGKTPDSKTTDNTDKKTDTNPVTDSNFKVPNTGIY